MGINESFFKHQGIHQWKLQPFLKNTGENWKSGHGCACHSNWSPISTLKQIWFCSQGHFLNEEMWTVIPLMRFALRHFEGFKYFDRTLKNFLSRWFEIRLFFFLIKGSSQKDMITQRICCSLNVNDKENDIGLCILMKTTSKPFIV